MLEPYLEQIIAKTFVERIVFHENLPSTNDLAKEDARSAKITSPTLYACDLQTAGRGRGSNQWQSAKGNLAFSIAFVYSKSNWQRNAIFAAAELAISVIEAIEQVAVTNKMALRTHYKWPNDVYLNEKKVCGILVEAVPVKEKVCAVFGCGINVNRPIDSVATSTSLINEMNGETSISDFLISILQRFEANAKSLNNDKEVDLASELNKRCLLRGRSITVLKGNQELSGIARGVNSQLELQIEVDGSIRSINAGSVTRF